MVNKLLGEEKNKIAEAIQVAEQRTSGEIRVHVAKKCPDDVLSHAKKIFHRLRMHRTHQKNAVLIFVALESKKLAILGDNGIHEHVGEDYWQKTRDLMLKYFSKNEICEGIKAGVTSVGEKLRKHFPIGSHNPNELGNGVSEE